ncbi:hypothetical protein GCM10010211_74170 [Streptomyces albospinus]|uniref:Cholesterol esterase n=1 Tax=Streptomyces albospinus TaxID=285515 RepID=A0ABQ2VNT8_9ACTN|nr:DUF6230 family protein [Streptomyces albospinus]GGU96157.1 hypothetical protein GCM10010211_74170 [Streptomyces albospinus]
MDDVCGGGWADHRLNRWRLAAASVMALVGAGGLLLCMAHGVLAVSVAGSGGAFKVTGEQLEGDGFTEVTDTLVEHDGTSHPVAVVGAERASVRGLCASLLVPSPFGFFTLRGAAGRTVPVQATGLVVNSDRVSGADTTITGLRVGLLPQGGVGIRAGHAAVSRARFTSWLATAGSFRVHDVDVTIKSGRAECH